MMPPLVLRARMSPCRPVMSDAAVDGAQVDGHALGHLDRPLDLVAGRTVEARGAHLDADAVVADFLAHLNLSEQFLACSSLSDLAVRSAQNLDRRAVRRARP